MVGWPPSKTDSHRQKLKTEEEPKFSQKRAHGLRSAAGHQGVGTGTELEPEPHQRGRRGGGALFTCVYLNYSRGRGQRCCRWDKLTRSPVSLQNKKRTQNRQLPHTPPFQTNQSSAFRRRGLKHVLNFRTAANGDFLCLPERRSVLMSSHSVQPLCASRISCS